MQLVDLTGETFGRLTVISRDANLGKKVAWLCRCECGTEAVVRTTDLRAGKVVSCGCYRRNGPRRKHGASSSEGRTPEYASWLSMKDRCLNPNSPGWRWYGGRGITVCARWRDSFSEFLEDMGHRPSLAYTLDRLDNDGNYEPANCRWATKKEQAQNRRWHPDSNWATAEDRNELGQFNPRETV